MKQVAKKKKGILVIEKEFCLSLERGQLGSASPSLLCREPLDPGSPIPGVPGALCVEAGFSCPIPKYSGNPMRVRVGNASHGGGWVVEALEGRVVLCPLPKLSKATDAPARTEMAIGVGLQAPPSHLGKRCLDPNHPYDDR